MGRQTTAAGSGSEPEVAGENSCSVALVEVALGSPVLEALGHLAEVAAGSKKSNSVVAAAELSTDLSILTTPMSTKLPSEAGPMDLRNHTVEEAD